MIWLGIFVAAVGLTMVVWGLSVRSRTNALISVAEHWPSVPGTITASSVAQGGTGKHATFSPVVQYEFDCEGRRYFGNQLRPGYVKVGSRAAAERMLRPYPVGARVPVRYNPADTNLSLLELRASSIPLFTAVVGALLILMGGGISFMSLTVQPARPQGPPTAFDAPALAPPSAESGNQTAAAGGERTGAPSSVTWRGVYTCGQGDTGLEVTVRPIGQGRLSGTVSFFPLPSNPAVPRGCYRVTGQANAATFDVELHAGEWVRQPPGYEAVSLRGRIGPDAGLSGQVVAEACGQFRMQSVPTATETCP